MYFLSFAIGRTTWCANLPLFHYLKYCSAEEDNFLMIFFYVRLIHFRRPIRRFQILKVRKRKNDKNCYDWYFSFWIFQNSSWRQYLLKLFVLFFSFFYCLWKFKWYGTANISEKFCILDTLKLIPVKQNATTFSICYTDITFTESNMQTSLQILAIPYQIYTFFLFA